MANRSNNNYSGKGFIDPFADIDSSPPRSPAKKGQETSPDEVKKLRKLVNDLTPTRSGDRREKETLTAGIKRIIGEYGDTPRKKRLATATANIANDVIGRVTNDDDDDDDEIERSPTQARRFPLVPVSKSALEDLVGTWPDSTLRALRTTYDNCEYKPNNISFPYFFNLDHITSPVEKTTGSLAGYHFAPNGIAHPECSEFAELGVNTVSKVWMANYSTPSSNALKQSTFFPKEIETVEALMQLLQTGKTVAKEKNMLLLEIPGKNFYVEAMIKNQHTIWSAYPILFFADYKENQTYNVTESLTLPSDKVLEYLVQAYKQNGFKYRVGFRCVVDIAPVIPSSEIKGGIYIQFSTDLINSRPPAF